MTSKLRILVGMVIALPVLPFAFFLHLFNFTPCLWCQWKSCAKSLFKKGFDVEVEDETDISGESLEKLAKEIEMNIPIEEA